MTTSSQDQREWRGLLDWNWNKTRDDGGPTVFFRGMQLWVAKYRLDEDDRPTRNTYSWYVHWSHVGGQKIMIRGLTDTPFPSRRTAMRAAENVFVPMTQLAPFLVEHTVTLKPSGLE